MVFLFSRPALDQIKVFTRVLTLHSLSPSLSKRQVCIMRVESSSVSFTSSAARTVSILYVLSKYLLNDKICFLSIHLILSRITVCDGKIIENMESLIRRDHVELLLAITYVNKHAGAKNRDLWYVWHMFIRSEWNLLMETRVCSPRTLNARQRQRVCFVVEN